MSIVTAAIPCCTSGRRVPGHCRGGSEARRLVFRPIEGLRPEAIRAVPALPVAVRTAIRKPLHRTDRPVRHTQKRRAGVRGRRSAAETGHNIAAVQPRKSHRVIPAVFDRNRWRPPPSPALAKAGVAPAGAQRRAGASHNRSNAAWRSRIAPGSGSGAGCWRAVRDDGRGLSVLARSRWYYTLSASGSSSATGQVLVGKELSHMQSPDAPNLGEKSGLEARSIRIETDSNQRRPGPRAGASMRRSSCGARPRLGGRGDDKGALFQSERTAP